ncbi:MAG: hypothetical protein ABI716_03300, partial [Candidatus Saccharibacteria bacterium]
MIKRLVTTARRRYLQLLRRTPSATSRALAFSFGEQDPMDIISYAGLEEQPNHLVIDGIYLRTLFISGYP